MTTELTGQSAVGYLRLNDIVQGDHIVLEGVEEREASNLADALHRAVDATNNACADRVEQPNENMPRDTAAAIAQRIGVDAPPGVPRGRKPQRPPLPADCLATEAGVLCRAREVGPLACGGRVLSPDTASDSASSV